MLLYNSTCKRKAQNWFYIMSKGNRKIEIFDVNSMREAVSNIDV